MATEDDVSGGVITADQMKRGLLCAEVKTSPNELEEMLQALDLDHDGKVHLEDFVRLLVNEQTNYTSKSSCDRCLIL